MSRKGILLAVVLILMAAMIVWQERRVERMTNEAATLREQVGRLSVLQDENNRLTDNLRITKERSEASLRELLRLRGETASRLRVQRDKTRASAETNHSAGQSSLATGSDLDSRPYQYTPEQWGVFVDKLNYGKQLGLALRTLAEQNEGQVPSALAPAAGWLTTNASGMEKQTMIVITEDSFELVFQGRLKGLKNPEQIILAREKDPVELEAGRWIRIYVFADGHVERVQAPTADGFAAREMALWPGDISR